MPRAVYDIDTGETIENVRYIITEDYIKAKKERENKRLVRSSDNFIFVAYEACKRLNIDNKDIFNQADITRIIYISSYLGNDNRLMLTERTPMTKEKLSELMGLNDRVFKRFYNKLISNNILIERDDCLYINKKFMFFGRIRNHKYSFIRAYKSNIQLLYNKVPVSKHKQLSILYLLIPFINVKYNIVSQNPFEEDKYKVIPITIEELSAYFEYNLKSFISLIDFLEDLKDKDNIPIIKTFNNSKNKKDRSIVINPRVVYAGNDYRDVEAFCPLFNR